MDSKKIGRRLTELRGNRRREIVAAETGLSFSRLVSYENGTRVPNDDAKIALARYYGLTVGELFFS